VIAKAAAVVVAALGLAAGSLRAQCPDGSPPPCRVARAVPVVVVLPFENRSRDTADTYLAATVGEDLAAALQRSRGVRLLSPRASRQGANYVVGGSIDRTGGAVRVTATLERAPGGQIVWTGSLDAPIARSDETVNRLRSTLLSRIGVRAPAATAPPAARSVDPVAQDLYLRGRYYSNRRTEAGLARGVALLREAVGRDSTFALGWAALARALHTAALWRLPIPGIAASEVIDRELEAAERALLNDSTSADIWLARAWAAQDVDPGTRTAAIRAERRALAIDSLNADAWSDLGLTLLEAGDTVGALGAARRGVALSPADPRLLTEVALYFYFHRQYDSARVWSDSIIATDPTFLSGRRMRGSVALAQGDLREAEAQFGAARTIGPGPERIWALGGLACVASQRGDTTAARALLSDAESLTPTDDPALH
jgi:TolB-like protein/Flp pilus assembly protein TadD